MTEGTKSSPLEVARLFVGSSPFQMTLLDLQGRLLAISPSVADMFHKDKEFRHQIIGLRADEIMPEAVRSIRELFERLGQGEALVEVDETLPRADGQWVNLRAQASYIRDEGGRPVAALFLHQDITAEIRAQAAQRESAAQLRAVIDHLPAQIALVDLDAECVEMLNAGLLNGAACSMGVSTGSRFRDVMPPERLARFEGYIAQAEAAGGFFEVEYPMGEGERIARVKHILFRDGHGRRLLLWIAEDVTELHQSEAALKRAADEAEAANRAKSEFLANMSHEIRTPLNGVMGVAGALARTQLTPAQQEMVSLVETSARTLEALLSDILDLARIEAGKMELRPEPFDLATSVNACGALFDAAAQAKGLDLDVAIAPDALGAYVGDAARIRQILSNLLSNAVKFTHAGRVSLTVDAHRGETSSQLKFEVRDTGIGFDAETMARLFSRFEQADGSITRRFGGSGLGLSISRSLAETMGGRLHAVAEPGLGACFTLTLELPRCEGALDLWCDTPEPESAPDPLVGMRVLLAEDHPTNRRVVELILGAAGVDLTCVENGAEAVQAFRASTFDLILMDMQMPVMDGLTAIREIRKLEAAFGANATPIHVLTANAMPEHISASLGAGADGHLSKPILADALLERVAETSHRRAAATSYSRARGAAIG